MSNKLINLNVFRGNISFFFFILQIASSFNSKCIHITTNITNVMEVATQQTFSARPKCFDLNCFLSVLFSRSVMVALPAWGNCSFTFATFTNSSMSLMSCGIFTVYELKILEKHINPFPSIGILI